ncbi:hypothetical protein TIFTF001_025231 [Ficus carica]|uniref:Uncharacterized protein n=1 Tax=Ficus carica TaxID=3494 RepID=A0AA88AMM8_FICCA|nr:hypothetical protein TIFTF001_025231 [Ficus carica]
MEEDPDDINGRKNQKITTQVRFSTATSQTARASAVARRIVTKGLRRLGDGFVTARGWFWVMGWDCSGCAREAVVGGGFLG